MTCFSLCSDALVASRLVTAGLDKPVYLTAPPEKGNSLYVVEQKGTVRIIKSNRLLKKPFLDITDRVHRPLFPGDEQGLLGMAFHPSFSENGFFLIMFLLTNIQLFQDFAFSRLIM